MKSDYCTFEPKFDIADPDNTHFRVTFSIEEYIRDLMQEMRKIEDAASEKVVIDWLRGRGYRVEKEVWSYEF